VNRSVCASAAVERANAAGEGAGLPENSREAVLQVRRKVADEIEEEFLRFSPHSRFARFRE
jgi:hypothetical protein